MTRVASELHRDTPVAAPGEVRPLAVGPLSVWPPVVLAPMAGVTNYPFRALCRRFGAGLYVSEMITARGFLLGNRLTQLLASSRQDEAPRSVQIYGSEPADVEEFARALAGEGVSHIDMNFGCPVPKVTRCGGGSAIPLRPRLLARLVRAAVRGGGGVPVTIKVRKGTDDAHLSYLDAGRVAEDEGAAAIGLHARTAAQLYSGEADWDAIAQLKRALRIPVLGNGDIWECWDALAMLRRTGCDGVIVGRGCLGRPWLFRELADVCAGREPAPPPCFGAVAEIALEHAAGLVEFFGPRMGMLQMRKWAAWYTKGFRGGNAVRAGLNGLHTLDDLRALFAALDPSEPFPRAALRAQRAKSGRVQTVALPQGWLDDPLADTAPAEACDADEAGQLDDALQGG
ncbi:MAG: tRNA dihydrouridine synthase DusB [Planctomycetes bacterium]|nr:tRNA dihydrouridine synthase DusB [Planctomycetota bacterium]